MKALWLRKVSMVLTVVAMTFSYGAQAERGGSDGGGGDPSERAFKEVATNILGWIQAGRAKGLTLPEGVSYQTYERNMMADLQKFRVSFPRKGVEVADTTKVCRNKKVGGVVLIQCHRAEFDKLFKQNTEEVYRLVHHEFAGASGLEQNKGADSDYRISDQISQFLETQTVRRLPVVADPYAGQKILKAEIKDLDAEIMFSHMNEVINKFLIENPKVAVLRDFNDEELKKYGTDEFEKSAGEIRKMFYKESAAELRFEACGASIAHFDCPTMGAYSPVQADTDVFFGPCNPDEPFYLRMEQQDLIAKKHIENVLDILVKGVADKYPNLNFYRPYRSGHSRVDMKKFSCVMKKSDGAVSCQLSIEK